MILIVDDIDANIIALKKTLEVHSLSVDTANSGEEALKKILKKNYSLIILDVQMPEMDGFTLTRTIKQDARFKGVPVVIHSSLTGTTNESHVKSVGADGYVAKFVAEELASTLIAVLKR